MVFSHEKDEKGGRIEVQVPSLLKYVAFLFGVNIFSRDLKKKILTFALQFSSIRILVDLTSLCKILGAADS